MNMSPVLAAVKQTSPVEMCDVTRRDPLGQLADVSIVNKMTTKISPLL